MDPPWLFYSLAYPNRHSPRRSGPSHNNCYRYLANNHPFKKRRRIRYNRGMRKIIASFSSVVLALTLTSCGYQGSFRYPCQDQANWDKAECNPPICETTGTCSRDIVGEQIWNDYQNSKVKNG